MGFPCFSFLGFTENKLLVESLVDLIISVGASPSQQAML